MAVAGKGMLRSFLIGLVAGQRGMTPLAAIATATRRGETPVQLPLQSLLRSPVISAGTAALAAAEMAGDKMKSAPDRIVPIGLAVRSITAAYAGAALAPRDRRMAGAMVAMGTALAASYIAGACAVPPCVGSGRQPPDLSRMRSRWAAQSPSPIPASRSRHGNADLIILGHHAASGHGMGTSSSPPDSMSLPSSRLVPFFVAGACQGRVRLQAPPGAQPHMH